MTTSQPGDLPAEFFEVSDKWRRLYPMAHAGVLAVDQAANPARSAALEERKAQVEEELRRRYAGMDRAGLRALPPLRAYADHYGQFDKTYHVQLQLESILFKGKAIPRGAALVEAMFMGEVESLLLTAGHDLDAVQSPLRLDVADGSESYVLLRGTAQTPKPGDMMISDSTGIISSIVYGPDQRTQIRPETTRAVFTVYAPAGIEPTMIEAHLQAIASNVKLISPTARVLLLRIHAAM